MKTSTGTLWKMVGPLVLSVAFSACGGKDDGGGTPSAISSLSQTDKNDGGETPSDIPNLSQPDKTGFDRELFISDGSNVSEVFDSGSYFQAGFRLAGSEGGQNFVSDWDKFLEVVNLLKNTAQSSHGVPLLITKAQFIAPEAMPDQKTFFMAALARKLSTIRTSQY